MCSELFLVVVTRLGSVEVLMLMLALLLLLLLLVAGPVMAAAVPGLVNLGPTPPKHALSRTRLA